jgi:hypothetical protein
MLDSASFDSVPAITRGRAGDIRLLRDINRSANVQIPLQRPARRHCDIFNSMLIGDTVFLEGYTTNPGDADPRLKKISMGGYTRNNTRVWTIRSTEENGIKGVRVYREA